MKNGLINYMNTRFNKDNEFKQNEPGPVITISRDYGCYASRIAELLSEKLSKITSEKWKRVSKEVLEEVSGELKRDPKEVSHIFGANQKDQLTEFIDAFSKVYTSDNKVKETIKSVVHSYASNGNSVIVGRAGCVIAKDIPKSLHIKLISDDKARVNRIKERLNISEKDAIANIKEIDKKRKTFMEFYNGNLPDADLFDVIINRENWHEDEIVDFIIELAKKRNLI